MIGYLKKELELPFSNEVKVLLFNHAKLEEIYIEHKQATKHP